MTVIFAQGACRLPVEIISMVIDWLDIADLLRASHICSKWRAVAHSHPTYWREIRLAAVSTTALDLFQARLDQTTDRDINITIRLADTLPIGRVCSIVLPALSRNLFRVVCLALDLHTDVASRAMSTLFNAAPRLESFLLGVFHCGEQPVVLPPALFAGSCPRLLAATLSDVELPTKPIVAFARVDSLIFSFERPRAFSTALFAHFPALQTLGLFGKSLLGARPEGLAKPPANTPPLTGLEVHIDHCNYDVLFFSIPNLGSINNIICRRPNASITQLLLSHLEGPVELDFSGLYPALVHIALCSTISGRLRTLVEHESHILEDWPREVLFSPPLLERISTLRLHSRFAYLTPHFAEMPKCRSFVLMIDEKGLPPRDAAKVQPLCLPVVTDVLVCTGEEHSTGHMSVAGDSLHNLLSQLLGPRATHPTLWLDGISLSGDSEAIWRDFDLRR